MKFEEPKVEFIEIESEVVTAQSPSRCTDGWTGGVIECTGSNMPGYCGDKMEITN